MRFVYLASGVNVRLDRVTSFERLDGDQVSIILDDGSTHRVSSHSWDEAFSLQVTALVTAAPGTLLLDTDMRDETLDRTVLAWGLLPSGALVPITSEGVNEHVSPWTVLLPSGRVASSLTLEEWPSLDAWQAWREKARAGA